MRLRSTQSTGQLHDRGYLKACLLESPDVTSNPNEIPPLFCPRTTLVMDVDFGPSAEGFALSSVCNEAEQEEAQLPFVLRWFV